jgi:predicted nucleotide-binding protein
MKPFVSVPYRAGSNATILLVDDELYFTSHVKDELLLSGYKVMTARSVDEAIDTIESQKVDLVIIDMFMPLPSRWKGNPGGDLTAGFELYKWIRLKKKSFPIIIHSIGEAAKAVERAVHRDSRLFFVRKQAALSELGGVVKLALGSTARLNIFIVHGRDMSFARSVRKRLLTSPHVEAAVILADAPVEGGTIIEKFESYARRTDVAIVLMTPDDFGRLTSTTKNLNRVRQNVLVEAGYFMGMLGRTSGRIILITKGKFEMPSDFAGVETISYEGDWGSLLLAVDRALKTLIASIGKPESVD